MRPARDPSAERQDGPNADHAGAQCGPIQTKNRKSLQPADSEPLECGHVEDRPAEGVGGAQVGFDAKHPVRGAVGVVESLGDLAFASVGFQME